MTGSTLFMRMNCPVTGFHILTRFIERSQKLCIWIPVQETTLELGVTLILLPSVHIVLVPNGRMESLTEIPYSKILWFWSNWFHDVSIKPGHLLMQVRQLQVIKRFILILVNEFFAQSESIFPKFSLNRSS